MSFIRLLSVSLAALTLCASACAHEYTLGDLHILHPHARPTVPMQPNGAAYLGIENHGKSADQLLTITTPSAAHADVHTMSMENNVMKMREVTLPELAPGSKITMTPGMGYHIMLSGLTRPLKSGETFPMTLTFKHAGKIDVTVNVDSLGGSMMPMNQGKMHDAH